MKKGMVFLLLLNAANGLFSFDWIAYPLGWDGGRNQSYIDQTKKTFQNYLTAEMEMYQWEITPFHISEWDDGYQLQNEELNIFLYDFGYLMPSEREVFIDSYAFIPLLIFLPEDYDFQTGDVRFSYDGYDDRTTKIHISCRENSPVYAPAKMLFWDGNGEKEILNDFFMGSAMGSIYQVDFAPEGDEIYATALIGRSRGKSLSILLNTENNERKILPIFLQIRR